MPALSNSRTGYPSSDKPWLKYYTDEAKNLVLSDYSIYQNILEKNKDYPGDIAIIYFGRKITYGELFKQIDSVSKMLLNIGISEGDTVSIIAITTPEIIYLLYACSRIGAVANMLDPRMSSEILANLIQNADSKHLFILDIFEEMGESLADKCDLADVVEINITESMNLVKKIGFRLANHKQSRRNKRSLSWKNVIKEAASVSLSGILNEGKGENPVLIEYTGGTTGFPKGVVLTNNNVNAVGEQYGVVPHYRNRGDLCQSVAAPFIAYTLIASTHVPLTTGKICKLTIYDPDKIADDIIHNQYNHVYGNPAMWSKVVNSEKAKSKDFSNLISPITGADAISISLWEDINRFLEEHNCKNVLCNGYGMTELASAVCVNMSKDIWKIGSVGIPLVKTVVSVFDTETGEELPFGRTGEVCVCGPSVMKEYLNNPAATDDIIRIHSDGKRWLHTGDLGHVDQDGFVFIDGRIKRMIIRANGAKVFPGEIERVILTIEETCNCAVVGKKEKNNSSGVFPVAFIVLKNNADQKEITEKVLKQCRKDLQSYAIPEIIRIIDKIPLTPVGKVDYRELERIAEDQLL